jgi:hypothetical protein
MYWTCTSDICSKIRVRAAAGVTQFTAMFADASSLPSDFVSAMMSALGGLYSDALSLRYFPATD